MPALFRVFRVGQQRRFQITWNLHDERSGRKRTDTIAAVLLDPTCSPGFYRGEAVEYALGFPTRCNAPRSSIFSHTSCLGLECSAFLLFRENNNADSFSQRFITWRNSKESLCVSHGFGRTRTSSGKYMDWDSSSLTSRENATS